MFVYVPFKRRKEPSDLRLQSVVCIIKMPKTINTTVYFQLRSAISKRMSRDIRLLSINHHRSVRLVCTSLEMPPASSAKPAVQGSTEDIVGP